jgi:hypothetical protein
VLQYAGGLGSILEGAEARVGGILTPTQVQAIYASGFEWGEYLGVTAPWERLHAPPDPDRNSSETCVGPRGPRYKRPNGPCEPDA